MNVVREFQRTLKFQRGCFLLPTKTKATNKDARGPTVTVRDEGHVYADMEAKLLRLNSEFAQLQEELEVAPSRQKRRALLDLEDAIIRVDEQIIAFLKDRPELAASVTRPDPLRCGEHLGELEWRQRLRSEKAEVEASLLKQQHALYERRQQEWHKSERARLDEQERKLLQALADRQAKLEDEWQMRRKTETEAQALAWLRTQQKDIARQMQDSFVRLRQDSERREAQWEQQTKRELEALELDWRKQRNAELTALETAWREQEVMHRERPYLRRMEAEWRAEQRNHLLELAGKWRSELQASQDVAWSGWQRQVSEHMQQQLTAELEAKGKEWLQLVTSHATKVQHEQRQDMKQELNTLAERAAREACSHLEQQLMRKQDEGTRVLTGLVDRRAREVQGEYVKQHQQEIELIGQEMRLDLKAALDKVASGLASEHEQHMRDLARDYQAAFALALERAEQAQKDVHASALALSHAEWLAESKRELTCLRAAVRDEINVALKALAQEMQSLYREGLGQAAEQDKDAREARDRELFMLLSARVEESLARSQTEVNAHLTAVERHLTALCREHLTEQQSALRVVHEQHLAGQYEQWLARCEERLTGATGELSNAFAGLLAELKVGMLTDYTVKIETLRDQMHLDYRHRLGKLAEELTAKHTSTLTALVSERDAAREAQRITSAPSARPKR